MLTLTAGLWRELEERLVHGYAERRRNDPLRPVIILTGTRLHADHLRWTLLDQGLSCFNLRFITLADLARDLALDAPESDLSALPVAGDLAAAAAAVDNQKGEHYFSRIADRPGFIRALSTCFADLDEAGIAGLDRFAGIFTGVPGKHRTLAALRRDYLDRLQRFRNPLERFDPPPDLRERFSKTYQTDRLTVCGLYDFNAAQWRLVEALAAVVQVEFLLPWWNPGDDSGSAFGYADPWARRLQALASTPIARESFSSDLPAFGKRLFRYDLQTAGEPFIPGDVEVKIVRADTEASEISELVGRISELTLWNEIPLSRIGVILWQSDQYLEPLRQALADAGLPFCDAVGTSLSQTAAARALVSLLNLAGAPVKRRELMDLIASRELSLSSDSPVTPSPDPVAWEAISVAAGIVAGGKKEWLQSLSELERRSAASDSEDRDESPLPAQQIAGFRAFVALLFDRLEQFAGARSWDELSAAAVTLIEIFIPHSDHRAALLDITAELSRLAQVSTAATPARFVQVLGAALEGVRINRGKFREDGITLCDRMGARGLSFEAAFIPGLVQGRVPVAPREDPILPDSDRIRLNQTLSSSDDFPLPLKSRRLTEEQLLFANAVDSARRRLILSWAAVNEQGKAQLPSRFLLEVCRVMTGTPPAAGDLSRLPFFEDSGDPRSSEAVARRSLSEREWIAGRVKDRVPSHARSAAIKQLYAGHSLGFDRALELLPARTRGDRFTACDGVMPDPFHQPPPEQGYAVTALEEYAVCPFRYLVRRGYRVEPWEEPERQIELSPLLIGQIVHRTLERLFRDTDEAKQLPLNLERSLWALDRLRDILTGVILGFRRRHPLPAPVWEVESRALRMRLERFVTRLCETAEPFSFVGAERAIKGCRLEFDHAGEPFALTISGKSDRIDLTPDGQGIRIVDYKTGSAHARPDSFSGGRSIQAPLYMLALIREFPEAQLASSCAEYLHLTPEGEPKSIVFDGGELERRLPELTSILKELTGGIESGLFPPLPTKEICRDCECAPVCDLRSRNASDRRQEHDPRLEALLRARDIE